ncbi:DUF5076 domain-containing protein [Sphingomonas sp.]|uniref:DUF5076 domain-containing protein n=1 Tax=Sphingomonas sp. TaxID=28214 RepID=UPI000DB3E728|nr:DUF5076 domain-containing protein [Sphingomonas sp.]PZU08580.1 MAG: DUF5076 domain-containing protein [Sphingomonas sp.]
MSVWEPPGRISLEGGEDLGKDSSEIARIWINDEGGASVWIAAFRLEDPRMFGYLMADTIRHAARAYAGTWSIGEDAALQKIAEGLSEALRSQTTIQDGSLN